MLLDCCIYDVYRCFTRSRGCLMSPPGKPKDEVSVDSSPSPQSSEPVAAPVKRKRGRPPKVLTDQGKQGDGTGAGSKTGTVWDALENPEKYALPPQKRGYASQRAESLRSDAPREQLNVRVRSELKRAVQIMAAAQNLSLGDIIEEAMIDYIKKNSGRVMGE